MPEQIGARTQAMLASSPIGAPAGSNSGVPVMEAEVTDDLASQPAAVLRHAGSAPLGLGWLGRQQGATVVQSSSLPTGLPPDPGLPCPSPVALGTPGWIWNRRREAASGVPEGAPPVRIVRDGFR
jgi:hypothetical protein